MVQGRRGGGWWNPSPELCWDMLQYFETILPSAESLWSSQQDEVYFMDGGAAGGLWRHSQWSPSWLPSWLLLRIRNQGKTARNGNFLCLTCKVTNEYLKKARTLHNFIYKLYFLFKEVEKTCIFTQKWLDHLLLMTSYLVTIETCLKMRARDKQTATVKTSHADVLLACAQTKLNSG